MRGSCGGHLHFPTLEVPLRKEHVSSSFAFRFTGLGEEGGNGELTEYFQIGRVRSKQDLVPAASINLQSWWLFRKRDKKSSARISSKVTVGNVLNKCPLQDHFISNSNSNKSSGLSNSLRCHVDTKKAS